MSDEPTFEGLLPDLAPATGSDAPPAPYRVLARKYRPASFDALIGQDAMVKTLANAIATGRLAHAFLLTGVRGVGKTSTARLLAKALNCVGPDGTGGATIQPCGQCEPCSAISESRHIDVIEMDAASHTGVDDVREIIEAVRYAAVSARYKIYIIDEVHMLSKSAFNALLKTLEEPPPHAKFIFATTEIRKVPVTVLSRCQRFDLKRIPAETLVAHFATILDAEGVAAEAEALSFIARAAEGSVRDGLSLLDQAIAHGAGRISAAQVRDMLGLADRTVVLDLYEQLLGGDTLGALGNIRAQYAGGVDPVAVLTDLLALTHGVTERKLTGVDDGSLTRLEQDKRALWAERLSHPSLHRIWQLLLKGLSEVHAAPSAMQAAEMALLRIAHTADLPDPADLLKRLREPPGEAAAPSAMPGRPPAGPQPAPRAHANVAAAPPLARDQGSSPQSFEGLVELCESHHEGLIGKALRDDVHLVRFTPGHVELRLGERARRDLPQQLGPLLERWTGQRWLVSLSMAQGEPTLREQARARAEAIRAAVLTDPLYQATLAAFPGAELVDIREMPAAIVPDTPRRMER